MHLLFLQNLFHFPGTVFSEQCLSALWSLAVEEQFYLVAPLLIRFLSRRRLVQVLLLAIAGAPLIRIVLLHLGHPGAMYALTPARADTLAWGVLAAVAWRSPEARRWLLARRLEANLLLAALFAGGVALFAPEPQTMIMASFGYSCLALFFTLLLLTVLLKPDGSIARTARFPLLREFGTVSYGMYLLHMPLNPLTHWLLRRAWLGFSTLPEISVTLLAFFLTWGVTHLSWVYFERPLVRRGHSYSYQTHAHLRPRPLVS